MLADLSLLSKITLKNNHLIDRLEKVMKKGEARPTGKPIERNAQ
jgi:hypothetical protein